MTEGVRESEPDIGRWLSHHAFFQPEKPAIIFEGRQTLTYGELNERVDEAAAELAGAFGVQRGARVAYLGFNDPAMIVLLFACARLGAILVPLNWRLTAKELTYIVANCAPNVVFHDDAHRELADEIELETEQCALRPISSLQDRRSLKPIEAQGTLDDPLLIVYTSGTTGRPKGAVLTQRALLVNALNSIDMHDLSRDDTLLVVLPLFHVGGLNIQLTPALYAGATIHLHQRFEPGPTLDAIDKVKPDLLVLVPATMQAIMALPAFETTDFSCLRMLTTGSTIVPVELIAAFEARGISVVQVYGSTETCPIATYQRPGDGRDKPESSGRAALLSAFRIVDGKGNEISEPEVEGEICVRGDHVMSGYWRDEEASAEVLRDGWFATGDIGMCGRDGELYYRDRKSHVIISGGENIYPAEVERVLREVDGVRDVAIVGIADERWGEVPVAGIVFEDDRVPEAVIRERLDGELARFKHPKHLIAVDALPRNAMGKVVAAEVKALVEARLDAQEESQ